MKRRYYQIQFLLTFTGVSCSPFQIVDAHNATIIRVDDTNAMLIINAKKNILI